MKLNHGLIAAGLLAVFFYSVAWGYCPSDMVAYWKLDENSGTTFADSSENAITAPGTCTSAACPSPVSGRISRGQQFASDTITVPANAIFDWSAGESFSVEVWVKTSAAISSEEILVGRTENGGSLRWEVGIAETGKAYARAVAADGSGGPRLIGGPALTNNQWHHIVFTRDAGASTDSLFVDSAKVGNATVTFTDGFYSDSAPVEIGSSNGTGYFSGTIDEVALYRAALSDSQVIQHYNDGMVGLRGGYCSPLDDIRIMPLGDSITLGSHSTNLNGYRKSLNLDLADKDSDGIEDYYINFVGSLSNGDGTFDMDHEGHSGWKASDLTANINTYLTNNPADVVVLHIGTNDLDDLYSGASGDVAGVVATAVANVDNLLDGIWAARPAATVVLARIILRKTDDPSDPDVYSHVFNESLEAMADDRINSGNKLVMVDHESALDYPDDLDDAEHPNDGGYAKMADVWYAGLTAFLPPTNEAAPNITSDPVVDASQGVAYSYAVHSQGRPNVTFALTVGPSGMVIDPDTGEISWTPASTGTADVTVTATNIHGSDTQNYQIDVTANAAPVAVNDTYKVANGGTLTVSAAQSILANDSDANGDTLQAQLVAGPSNGSLSLNANGSFTYTHDGSDGTKDSFTYRASDGTELSNVATVTITITTTNPTPTPSGGGGGGGGGCFISTLGIQH